MTILAPIYSSMKILWNDHDSLTHNLSVFLFDEINIKKNLKCEKTPQTKLFF